MKVIACFFVWTLVMSMVLANDNAVVQKKKQFSDECKKELKTSDADYGILAKAEVPANEAQKCLLECIYKKFGLINKNGKVDAVAAEKLAELRFEKDKEHLTKAKEVIKKCQTDADKASTTEKCVLGKVIRNCIIKYGQNTAFLFKKA
ncbi:general odorant-binding protein 19d-like [Planococcus citri]|uniref:general odorant-binding protein 19d-like n=1 Tax=Planococcus citri TaxID=170843 RepID=UPI0031F94F08